MARVITIDGPSGSGKGTVGQLVAKRLGWRFLDSGALYRVLGLAAWRRGISTEDHPALVRLAGTMNVEFVDDRVVLDGEDVSDAIRDSVERSLHNPDEHVAFLQQRYPNEPYRQPQAEKHTHRIQPGHRHPD